MRKRRYLLSLGISFYPEKEVLRIEAMRRKGWRFVKMNQLGLMVFEPCQPAEKKYAIDFLAEDPQEAADFLELYQAAGWQCVYVFGKHYYYFEADPETLALFSDAATYQEKIKLQEHFAVRQVWYLIPLGFLLLFIGFTGARVFPFLDEGVVAMLKLMGYLLVLWPFMMVAMQKIFALLYWRRKEHFRNPTTYAKGQQVWRDTLIFAVFGGIIGLAVAIFAR